MDHHQEILVFSHLRWDFVFQRPQHLLSRLASAHRILFFEEPLMSDTGEAYLEFNTPEPNILVCRPHTPVADALGFCDAQLPYLANLVQKLIQQEKLDDFLVWFYTPMALPLAKDLHPQAIIYDCMDELSAFWMAPPQLLQREAELLKCADLVFTGGPSLFAAKKDRHPDVYCFPSSVDAAHFAQANSDIEEAAQQRPLARPRLGYYGVIDERLDPALLDAMAQKHPEWQIIMVGPVVKIDPSILPRHENIHYFGQQSYADLPRFLKGWDVCLLPFAQNAATRFLSPTKTLEYMAAERMIVSTPIQDVREAYQDIVYLADTPAAFTAACEQALRITPPERLSRIAKMREVLSRTSWDSTVASMEKLIAQTINRKRSSTQRHAMLSSSKNLLPTNSSSVPITASKKSKKMLHSTIIAGAGPTGLSTAYHLGADALLLDQNERVGGWCRSIEDKGFTFDFAGHIMFSNDPYVHELYQLLLGDNVHWQDREAWVYSKQVYTRYPFQGALYGLPPSVIKECLVGAIEARFGSIKPKSSAGNPAKANGSSALPMSGASSPARNNTVESINDCCADGILESTIPLLPATPVYSGDERRVRPRVFEEFIYKVWGAGIAKHFAIPYNKKLWAVPLTEMETSWLGPRVPLPDLEEMIEGALQPAPKPMGPNARFGYPLRGGFQALMDGFLPHLKAPLHLSTRIVKVSPAKHSVTLENGSELNYQHLVSTMPLPVLINLMGDEAPSAMRSAAAGLRHVSVRCVNIGVGRENLTDKHWIYYPEDTVFHRIFVQGNASPHNNAPGGFGFTCEITYSEYKPLPCDGEALIQRCIEDAIRVGFIKSDDPIWTANQVDMPYAYVVYDHARRKNVATLRDWLEEHDIVLAGRYSEWEYYNSDHAFIAGKKAAQAVRELQQASQPARTSSGSQLISNPLRL